MVKKCTCYGRANFFRATVFLQLLTLQSVLLSSNFKKSVIFYLRSYVDLLLVSFIQFSCCVVTAYYYYPFNCFLESEVQRRVI